MSFWEVSYYLQFNHQLHVPFKHKVHTEALLSKLPLLEGEALQRSRNAVQAFSQKMNPAELCLP